MTSAHVSSDSTAGTNRGEPRARPTLVATSDGRCNDARGFDAVYDRLRELLPDGPSLRALDDASAGQEQTEMLPGLEAY